MEIKDKRGRCHEYYRDADAANLRYDEEERNNVAKLRQLAEEQKNILQRQEDILRRQAKEQSAHLRLMEEIAQLAKSDLSRRLSLMSEQIADSVSKKIADIIVDDFIKNSAGIRLEKLPIELWLLVARYLDANRDHLAAKAALSDAKKQVEHTRPTPPVQSEQISKDIKESEDRAKDITYDVLSCGLIAFLLCFFILKILEVIEVNRDPFHAKIVGIFALVCSSLVIRQKRRERAKRITAFKKECQDYESEMLVYSENKTARQLKIDISKQKSIELLTKMEACKSEAEGRIGGWWPDCIAERMRLDDERIWNTLKPMILIYQEKYPTVCHIPSDLAFHAVPSMIYKEIGQRFRNMVKNRINTFFEGQFSAIAAQPNAPS